MRKGNDMLFEFGPYKADIDVYKTKLFYEKHGLAAGGCDCDGCRNFARAAETLPQPVRSQLPEPLNHVFFHIYHLFLTALHK